MDKSNFSEKNEQIEEAKESQTKTSQEQSFQQKKWLSIFIIIVIVFAILIGLGVSYLAHNPEQTSNIRDIFIIIMALESLFVGFVLALLVIQLARLINLLQNEIKPILDSTNDTANTLRGTAVFLSDQLTEPIIQLNGYLAALQKVVELFRLTKK